MRALTGNTRHRADIRGGPDPFHRNSNDPEWAPETQYSPLISLRRLAREKCRDL